MAFSAKSLRLLSFVHVVLGFLACADGLAAIRVTEYHSGVFGMGIWLGCWIVLTGLAGLASSLKPWNFCRIGIFLGFCLVAIVLLSICSIIIGTVVIRHFEFESSVTRDYYKDKGTFGQQHHDDFYKPEKYFDERHEKGRIGLAVYGSLLVINICDVLLCCASVYVCRDLTRREQATHAGGNSRNVSLSRYSQRNAATLPIAELGYGGQNWAELVFPGVPQSLQPVVPGHFIQNPDFQFFTPYKLPNYAELYPNGIDNPGSIVQNEDIRQRSVPDEPPPAYTPTANPAPSQLPGSSLEVPLNSLPLVVAEENTSAQVSTTGTSVITSTAELPNGQETDRVSELSTEHSRFVQTPSHCPVSYTPVHMLQVRDSALALPVISSVAETSEINTGTSVSASPGLSLNSLPNSVQLSGFNMDQTVSSVESQNNTAHSETVPTTGKTNTSTSDNQEKDQHMS